MIDHSTFLPVSKFSGLRSDSRFRRLPSAAASLRVVGNVWHHESNRGHRLRALARALSVQLRWRLLGRPTVVPFASRSKVEVRLDSGASKRVAYAQLPDVAEMRLWQRELRPGDLFVDIGANVGLYTLLACELGCEVIAVEPLPEAADQLEANLLLNGYSARVVRAAVDDRPGIAHVAGPDDQRSHLSDDGLSVPAVSLDELIGDRYVAGLKVDVEGAERRVLLGGSSALREQRVGLMQLEWNDRAHVNFNESRDQAAAVLVVHGYSFARPGVSGVLSACEPVIGDDLFARLSPTA